MEIVDKVAYNPLVSVIIPVFNVEKYLRDCLSTVVNQTYNNIEIIVIDDGSIDESRAICELFVETDSRMRLISKPNGGQASARNVAINISRGEFLFFVDSDDLLANNCIERSLQILLENDADYVQGEYKRFWKENDLHKVKDIKRIDLRRFDAESAIEAFCYQKFLYPAPWCKLIKREIWGDILFREGIGYEDYDVAFRVLGRARKIVCTNEVLYFYRIHNESAQHEEYSLKKRDRIEISNILMQYVQKHFPRVIEAAKVRYQLARLQYLMELPLGSEYDSERCTIFTELKKYRQDCICNTRCKISIRFMMICSFCGAKNLSRLGRLFAKITRR